MASGQYYQQHAINEILTIKIKTIIVSVKPLISRLPNQNLRKF